MKKGTEGDPGGGRPFANGEKLPGAPPRLLRSGPRKGDEVRTAAGIVPVIARLTATPIASPPVTWSKVLDPEGVARFRSRVPLSCSPATTNPGFAAHSGVPFAQARL